MWRWSQFGLLCVMLSRLMNSTPGLAGDWPQILGPNRNGIAVDEQLEESWPEAGPQTLWQREVGSGFSGVAVANGRLILFHRIGNSERVQALRAATGEPLWQVDYLTDYVPSYTSDSGPRAVPLIHGQQVFVYGAKGQLRCIDLKTGAKVWERDTFEDYNSKKRFRGEPPEGYFGIGSSPIVEGEQLIVNVGGETKGAGLVAFALDSGKTVWKSTKERASYSSPIAVTVSGIRHLIFATRLNVISVDPTNGEVRFRFPFGHPGPTVTAANPVVIDGHLFITASYGFGAVFASIQSGEVEPIWSSDELMSSQYTTCVTHQGKLFGTHGRQDLGRASLRCVDPKSQKTHWSEDDFGYATLIRADNKLVVLKTDGELVLARLSPTRFQALAKSRIFRAGSTSRALPALSDGLFYARDAKTLKCLDLRKQK